MTRKDRIGIFGGTFNPIHAGHIRAAVEVRARFSLDRVLFVPSFIPPHKDSTEVASPGDRMAMIELALRRYRRLIPSPIEIEAGGTSYSIVTLDKVRRLYPGARIFFILGADAFLDIETWREWRRVLERCLFIVTTRPGSRLSAAREALAAEYRDGIVEIKPATRIRETLLSSRRIFLTPISAVDVSSTGIRSRVRRGASIRGLVPSPVARYIAERGLYRNGTS
jgi:nicotinate-nucleotide adenylyltransferase